MPIRRKSDPTSVQCIWDAIKYLLWQRLPPETNKVVMQLIKLNGFSSEEWEKCIKEAIRDNLVRIGFRRDKKTKIYKMPNINMLVLDGRDWYCFECHLAGEVVFCKNKSCPRVFHSECVTKSAVNNYRLYKNIFNNSDSTVFLKKSLPNRRKSLCLEYDGIEMVGNENIIFTKVFDNSLCTLCNIVTLDDLDMDKSELNHLLGFVLHRIRSWIPENIAHKLEGPEASPVWQTQADLSFRASHLFFENKDMSVIDANIKSKSYSKCYSFLSDVLTIIHNIGIFHGDMSVIDSNIKSKSYSECYSFLSDVLTIINNIGIFHGVESQEYQATKFVLRDTLHDLGEIIGCSDCYKHSNDQINQNWFSLPCKIEHELVWAKQKGYCYWPAKVVKKGTSHYDVRFFGGQHERALLSQQFVQPISISKESLKARKSLAFVKALEELDLHQKLSKSPAALEAFIASSVEENSLPKAGKSSSESPKKLKSPKSSVISNMVQDKELSRQKRGRPKTHTKEPSHQPVCKKGRLTMRTEKDSSESSHEAESPKGRRSMPTKKASTVATDESSEKRDILYMPIKEDRKSPEIGTDEEDVPQTKKREKSFKKSGKQTRKGTNRITRSSAVDPKHDKEELHENVYENEVINISDGEDIYTLSENLTMSAMKYVDSDEQLQQVTSSTEIKSIENLFQSHEMQQLDHPFTDEVEMMRRTLDGLSDKKEIIKCAMNCMQSEIDRITEKHNDLMKKVIETHHIQISATKRKQWCFYCEQDAIYHCCWNTAYCSTTCQQKHWLVEHKKVCRRKK